MVKIILIRNRAGRIFAQVKELPNRREQAQAIVKLAEQNIRHVLFALLDEKLDRYEANLWKSVRPHERTYLH